MFESLTDKLTNVVKVITRNHKLTESNIAEILETISTSLLEADVAISVVKELKTNLSTELIGQKVINSLNPSQTAVKIIQDKLTELMFDTKQELNLRTAPPAVLLMAGLQGAGKTTTSAKLAKLIKTKHKKKVLLVSVDVYRPAAIEQLKVLAEQVGVEFFNADSNNPIEIAIAAHNHAKRYFFDVLIVDTAGRLSIDENMMTEVKELKISLNPIEILFVADAMLGQDSVNTAKTFNETLTLTGVILTKIDGDARGGAALSIKQITGKPIKFLGISEKIDGLEVFHPDRLVSRILGLGDILSLIENVEQKTKKKEVNKIINKINKGQKFNLYDFKTQLEELGRMGGMSSILDKLPKMMTANLPTNIMNDGMRTKYIAIINSMTKSERYDPNLLKASHKQRIAKGSGTMVQDINLLLKQYDQIANTMKKMGGGGMMHMMKQLQTMMSK